MRLIFLIYLCASPGAVFATDASTEDTTKSSTTSTTKTTTPISPIVTPAAPAASTTPSINPSANTGQASQSGGSGANMAAAAALMAACMATQPPNIALCMMGALAAMQGGADKNAADQSGQTAAVTDLNNNVANSGTSAITYAQSGSGSAGILSPTVKAGMQTLNDAGYKVTPTTITNPDGSTSSASSFSPASMSGLSADQVKDANKVLAQVNADVARQYGVSSLAVDGGGGGGASSAANNAGSSGERVKLPNFKNPFALSADAQKKLIAGKTVLLDGEPIGTKGANIFDMMHEAYGRQRGANAFIESENDGVQMRAPASTHVLFPPLKGR